MKFKVLIFSYESTYTFIFDSEDKDSAIEHVKKYLFIIGIDSEVDSKWTKRMNREFICFWTNVMNFKACLFVHAPKIMIRSYLKKVENFYKEEEYRWF